jgi:NNP family nitrate/nitrite transporter-like MFS transporter
MRQNGTVYRLLTALRSGHWPSLMAAWLHFETSFMVWLLVGALGVLIADAFDLTATQKGFMVAVPLLSGACLRVPVGVASDRFGAKRVGLLLLLCEAVALLWTWHGATDYKDVLGVGLLLGSAGASFAMSLPLASRAYPQAHQGLAMGVAASGNSGTFLAAFFAPRLAQAVGWQGVFGLMLVPVVMTAVAFGVLVPRQLPHAGVPHGWKQLTADLLRQRSTYWLCFLYAVTFGGFVGFCSFLPIFFHDQHGLDLVAAGSLTALCGLAGSLARPCGGHLADRIGGPRLLTFILPGIASLAAAVGMLSMPVVAGVVTVLAVALMGFGNGVVFRIVSDRFQKQIGTASGIVGAAGGFGGFLLPAWLGLLKDMTGSYEAGFLLFAALGVAAWLSTMLALRAGGAACNPAELGPFSH